MTQLPFLVTCMVIIAAQAVGAQLPIPIQRYLRQPGFTWKCELDGNFHYCWETILDSWQTWSCGADFSLRRASARLPAKDVKPAAGGLKSAAG